MLENKNPLLKITYALFRAGLQARLLGYGVRFGGPMLCLDLVPLPGRFFRSGPVGAYSPEYV